MVHNDLVVYLRADFLYPVKDILLAYVVIVQPLNILRVDVMDFQCFVKNINYVAVTEVAPRVGCVS